MTDSRDLFNRIEQAHRLLDSLKGSIPYTPPECLDSRAFGTFASVFNVLDPHGMLREIPEKATQQYAIHATLSRTDAGWHVTKQYPTFYLNANVQGILTEHTAERVARNILDPFDEYGDRLSITAYKQ